MIWRRQACGAAANITDFGVYVTQIPKYVTTVQSWRQACGVAASVAGVGVEMTKLGCGLAVVATCVVPQVAMTLLGAAVWLGPTLAVAAVRGRLSCR